MTVFLRWGMASSRKPSLSFFLPPILGTPSSRGWPGLVVALGERCVQGYRLRGVCLLRGRMMGWMAHPDTVNDWLLVEIRVVMEMILGFKIHLSLRLSI